MVAGIASAFVDNIPFTATMVPLIETLNTDPNIALTVDEFQFSPLWWALALGADIGGNGTLIGSSAGVVAADLSERFGYYISFIRWFKIGFSVYVNNFGYWNHHTSTINYNTNAPLRMTKENNYLLYYSINFVIPAALMHLW